MPKVVIEDDSLYPYYFVAEQSLDEWPAHAIELTDDELADYRRVSREFDAWQTRLAQALQKKPLA